MDEERMRPKPLVEVSALFFPVVLRHCSLGDRKSVGPIKILCHLSPEILFQSRWRRKTQENG